mmetsp:Transcript_79657/g.257573  ORF Transcript_79657/g.257573 Transcript_79657/m.257573 type:complete len:228 (+) Transcript_79657:1739-2422(+)
MPPARRTAAQAPPEPVRPQAPPRPRPPSGPPRRLWRQPRCRSCGISTEPAPPRAGVGCRPAAAAPGPADSCARALPGCPRARPVPAPGAAGSQRSGSRFGRPGSAVPGRRGSSGPGPGAARGVSGPPNARALRPSSRASKPCPTSQLSRPSPAACPNLHPPTEGNCRLPRCQRSGGTCRWCGRFRWSLWRPRNARASCPSHSVHSASRARSNRCPRGARRAGHGDGP